MNKRELLDFGGPIGNAILIFALPAIPYALYFFLERPADFSRVVVPAGDTVALYLLWFFFQAALQAWLPGKTVEGTELPDGKRLRYKMNGPLSLVVSLLVVFALCWYQVIDPGILVSRFPSFLTTMIGFVFVLAIFLYAWGRRPQYARHVSGNFARDFFMGTGHNPRIGSFDLKFFCEARPGLILWLLIDASCAYTQYQALGHITAAMWLVCGLQASYIFDYYFHEPAILTTMDIKHENFGFMLCFGDLVWVPMTYTLQALYCIDRSPDLSWPVIVLLIAMNFGGLAIFRTVNNQKNRFRSSPVAKIWGKPIESLQTQQGNRLLLSGFWGWARHFNYVGDLLMAWSWSLATGFGNIVTYYYPIYFTILLVHRERRDDALCREKYGADWDRYCQHVRWRILPGVY